MRSGAAVCVQARPVGNPPSRRRSLSRPHGVAVQPARRGPDATAANPQNEPPFPGEGAPLSFERGCLQGGCPGGPRGPGGPGDWETCCRFSLEKMHTHAHTKKPAGEIQIKDKISCQPRKPPHKSIRGRIQFSYCISVHPECAAITGNSLRDCKDLAPF